MLGLYLSETNKSRIFEDNTQISFNKKVARIISKLALIKIKRSK
jgi:hypothetical protein